MKLLIQRVLQASVSVNKNTIGSIDKGLLVFIGISKDCSEQKLDYMIDKLLTYRLFNSSEKGFDFSVSDVKGELLIVSQFTLWADTKKGRKPSFNDSMEPEKAKVMYDLFISKLKSKTDLKVNTGEFGAMMEVSLVNDGPVTIMLEK